jgi:phage repressor protein C with HTH and peptisase S24 domain
MRTDAVTRDLQAARLREARVAAGFATAAKALERNKGWKTSTYMAHENAQNGISVPAAIKYGTAYRVDAGWILTGTGRGPRSSKSKTQTEKPGIISIGPQDFTAVGRFDAAFSMGPGSLIADHPEPLGYWMIETQWLRALSTAAPEDLAIVRCEGDSMERTLFDGDWVLVDKNQKRLAREGLYAVRVGDASWVKRISLNIKTKKIRVLSDNPTTPPQPDVDEDELAIVGRVIAMVARRMP